jgi:serine/threonine-protein kinase
VVLAPGTRLGPYEVAARIGVGGMGEVYRARDTNLGRDVAIKVLPETFAQDAERLARFEREAKTLASLNHPNIAQIYGIDRSDGGAARVMELVEGMTLADRIAMGPIPVDEALPIAAQIVDALEAAHERGIVHRDLKPANIVLRSDGVAKVLDFGLAKALEPVSTAPSADAPTVSMLTEVGVVMGTAAYMSPEQTRGRPVDERTDVWAFGCVLYEMLTGQRAFRADDAAGTLARVLESDVNMKALPSKVPAAVRRTTELCLRKDPRKRLRDIGDVRLSLEGELVPEQADAPRPQSRLLLFGAGTLVLALLLAVAYFIVQLRRAPSSPAAPPAVSRLSITTPATAPLASVGGLDLAIAPDGRRIAYFVQLPGERVQLYVRELDGLDARPLAGTEAPGSSGSGNMNPFFSADGKSIGLFVPDRGVISVPIDGGPPVKILDPPVPGFIGASWAADNTLIYSSGFRLQRVSAAGGGTPAPLMPTTEGRFVASPVPLPGGRAVLFHIFGGDTNRIAVINLDTKQEKTLVDGASNMFYLDSGHLVFARGDTLMAVPFDLSRLSIAGDPVALVQGIRHPAGGAADFVISANGTLAYVPASEATEATYAVVWVDRRGNVIERAVPDLVINGRDPRLSPDGKHLLLVTGLISDGTLWNYDLGGRPPLPLARANDYSSPVWDPTGREVAFTIGPNSRVLTLPVDGAVRARQTLSVSGMPQAWSAAGELLVQWPMGNPDILATSAHGSGEARKILASEYGEFHPAISANGRWIAYVSNRTGQNEIWVQGYPDGAPVRVSSSGGDEPLWSSDGRELFYRQAQAMMVVAGSIKGNDFSFGPPQQLFTGPFASAAGEVARSYDVSRDGRFLMLQPADSKSTRTTASIIVVQNFIEELKRRVRRSGQ